MKQAGIVWLTCVVALACSLVSLPSASPITANTAADPTQAVAPALTADLIKNMQVQLVAGERHDTLKLTNGLYQAGTDPAGTDYVSVTLVPDLIAFGDLNHDGVTDAAALLAENYGGTGVFTSVLAILNVDGKPVQAGAVTIDDRPLPAALEIKDGQIVFRGSVHGPNDPGCCPSMPVVETFGLGQSGLELQRLASGTPTGEQRSIKIESPANGSQVPAAALQVKGSFTISAFENTFACKVVDATGKEWVSGPITVSAEMGKPGTIDHSVDLSMVPPGTLVRLEIMDVSAADGSTLAMDSVELTIK